MSDTLSDSATLAQIQTPRAITPSAMTTSVTMATVSCRRNHAKSARQVREHVELGKRPASPAQEKRAITQSASTIASTRLELTVSCTSTP